MEQHMYPDVSKDLAQKRRELAPDIYGAFRAFSQRVFADGALSSKTKELIAVAVAHVTQCPYCIRGHTNLALKKGGDRTGDHGGNLGRGGDANWRCLRAFDPSYRRDGSGGNQA